MVYTFVYLFPGIALQVERINLQLLMAYTNLTNFMEIPVNSIVLYIKYLWTMISFVNKNLFSLH